MGPSFKEYMADTSDPITLLCEVHNYSPGGAPRLHMDCKQCILVDFIYMIAKLPKEQQMEKFEEFEAIVTAMCELEDEGQLDISLMRHPIVTIERDVDPAKHPDIAN